MNLICSRCGGQVCPVTGEDELRCIQCGDRGYLPVPQNGQAPEIELRNRELLLEWRRCRGTWTRTQRAQLRARLARWGYPVNIV